MNWRFTNTLKHLGAFAALGLLVWAFAYFGKAQGLGFFPTIGAFMVGATVEYNQKRRSGLPWLSWIKRSLPDSIADMLADVVGFAVVYHGLLRLFTGVWYV